MNSSGEDKDSTLYPIKTIRKTGCEQFHDKGESLGFDLISFWQWSCSDIVSNATRGVLAEYLVSRAVGVGVGDIRHEWDSYDLKTPDGVKIEVKSAAYLQSWAQKEYSKISFGIKARHHWDYDTALQSKTAERPADIYVFALLKHKDKKTVDPLNISQWIFFVVDTETLNKYERSQHSITLVSLKKLTAPVSYNDLKARIQQLSSKNG